MAAGTSVQGVSGLSFDVEQGSVTGFLGANGAGNPATELRHSLRWGG
jgi:ABC-type Na+ transport system ATPase subunit NatA